MFKRILVPIDGSERSNNAMRAAVELARMGGGRLFAVHVVAPVIPDAAFSGMSVIGVPAPVGAATAPTGTAHDPALLAVRRAAHEAGVRVDSAQLVDLDPAQAIAQAARRCECDLIVMGSRGRSGILSAITGSTSGTVYGSCDVPVLLVH